jgi:peptidyl-tRNA hydrolase
LPAEDDFEDEEEDYKMIFVVRMDLKLQLSKIAECVATAALKAYQQMEAFVDVDQLKEYAFFEWSEGGQRKIVVKAQSEKELLDVIERVKQQKINYSLVYELPSKFKVALPEPSKKAKREKGREGEAMVEEPK